MSSCCTPRGSCCGTNAFFSRWARFYAKRFRTGGLEPVQKYLLDGIQRDSVLGRTVLDIGCGVGSLHLSLLEQGAAHSIGVDLSEGMLSEARRFADEFGLTERTRYIAGDFTQLSASIPESDITLLDKVVCCYDDLAGLVRTSTAKTNRVYALSHPKENIFMKTLFRGHVILAKCFGWKFHPFWHDWRSLQSMILSQGFRLLYQNSTLSWQVLVFQRLP